MKSNGFMVALLCAAVFRIVSCSRAISRQTLIMQNTEHNKSIIRDFYRRTVANGDLDYAEQIIADNYIQHSLMVKPGKAGLLEALKAMQQMPKPTNPAKPFMRLIAENEYVVTNLGFELGGKHMAVVDLFRLRNGQVIEHWDAVQQQPETTLNGHPMMDGAVDVEDMRRTEANKKVVEAFCRRVLIGQEIDALSDYVSSDLIQHKPEIANGRDGLWHYLQQTKEDFAIHKVLRIIGEGNFVVVQSEGLLNRKSGTFYDIFRLNQGKIVEQWGVQQLRP
ncbi:nuclear transport factor 2 family protein [Larkinella sp. C7]|jgi:predicted SnoaL-like aldol condensation-catalyzing enzyme|uniref:nuclear transport factor 2 family protein n=1 Tax=Larkinella sp. C7 TaxID=2576607 RepID=UPI001E487608|nr:nuclear transport factor 2 family protein [Larkinella sp. C7]